MSAKPALAPKGSERLKQARAIVDELGALEKEMARIHAEAAGKLGTKPARAGQLRAELAALYDNAPAAVPFVADGEHFVATFSARSNKTEITSMAKVHKFLGRPRVLSLCVVPLGVLRAELTPEQLTACTKTERTGPRSLMVAEKGIAA